jgi:hypothetical protein
MKTPVPKPEWLTPAVEAHLLDLEYQFQAREFGEEMAEVNRLPLPQRRQYVHDIVDRAISRHVNLDHPAIGVTT